MKSRLICLSLLLTSIIYLPGMTGSFAFDDYANIVRNPYLTAEVPDADTLSKAVWSGQAGPLKRPVAMLTFALNTATTGHWPMAYKVTNLAIHLLNGVLAFFCALLLLKAHLNQRDDSKQIIFFSAAVATIWLIHPINLTPVLYVVQRMTSLAALFSFAAIIAYCIGRFALIDKRHGIAALNLFIALPLTVALGAFSKENALLVLPVLGAIEYFFFRFRGVGEINERLLRFGFQVFCIAIIATIAWYFLWYRPDYFKGAYASRTFSLVERLLTEARVLWFYLSLIVFPQLSDFALYHDDIALSTGLFEPVTTFFSCVGIFIACLASLVAARKFPVFGFCVAFFVIGHSMESSIFPLELVHEHRNYFPSFGIIFGLAYLASTILRKIENPRASIAGAALMIFLLSGLTFIRAGTWSDPVTLALTEAEYHPTSYRSVYAAGRIYYGFYLMRGDPAHYDKAIDNLLLAAALDKSAKRPYFGLIKLSLATKNEIPKDWNQELLNRLGNTHFKNTDWLEMHEMVKCHAESDDCNIPKEKIISYFFASLSNPTLTPSAKSQLLLDLSVFYVNEIGDFDKATEILAEAVSIRPRKFERRMTYAEVLMLAEKYDEVAVELDRIEGMTDWQDAHAYSDERVQALRDGLASVTDNSVEPGTPPADDTIEH